MSGSCSAVSCLQSKHTEHTRSHKSSLVGRGVDSSGVCTADLASVTPGRREQQVVGLLVYLCECVSMLHTAMTSLHCPSVSLFLQNVDHVVCWKSSHSHSRTQTHTYPRYSIGTNTLPAKPPPYPNTRQSDPTWSASNRGVKLLMRRGGSLLTQCTLIKHCCCVCV